MGLGRPEAGVVKEEGRHRGVGVVTEPGEDLGKE